MVLLRRRGLRKRGLVVAMVALCHAVAGMVAAQEIRPTLQKIKETGVIHLAYRQTAPPLSFLAQDSIGERLGLRGGDRLGIVEGQQLIVGGDILLKVQDIDVANKAGMVQALKTLETLKPGQDMRVTVFRDGRIMEFRTKWTGR